MKRWFKYVKPYLPYFILGPIGMIVEVIGEMFMPLILGQIIDNAELTVPSSIGYAGVLIGIVLMMMAGGVAGAYFGAKASVNFAADLRKDLYSKVQQFSFANIDKFSASSLVTRMTNDVTQLQTFVNMLLRMALRSPGMLIGGIVMAIIKRPSLATILAVVMPIMLIVLLLIIGAGFPRFEILQKKIDKLNSTVR
jgi:ATP-binding cassette subfamily B protein